MGQYVFPVGRSEWTGRLSEVADNRHRSAQRSSCGHLELHRSEILHLVDHNVTVGADLVAVIDLAVFAQLRPEHVAGVIEQGDVSHRPAHIVDRFRPLTEQRQRLGFVEYPASCDLQESL